MAFTSPSSSLAVCFTLQPFLGTMISALCLGCWLHIDDSIPGFPCELQTSTLLLRFENLQIGFPQMFQTQYVHSWTLCSLLKAFPSSTFLRIPRPSCLKSGTSESSLTNFLSDPLSTIQWLNSVASSLKPLTLVPFSVILHLTLTAFSSPCPGEELLLNVSMVPFHSSGLHSHWSVISFIFLSSSPSIHDIPSKYLLRKPSQSLLNFTSLLRLKLLSCLLSLTNNPNKQGHLFSC